MLVDFELTSSGVHFYTSDRKKENSLILQQVHVDVQSITYGTVVLIMKFEIDYLGTFCVNNV